MWRGRSSATLGSPGRHIVFLMDTQAGNGPEPLTIRGVEINSLNPGLSRHVSAMHVELLWNTTITVRKCF